MIFNEYVAAQIQAARDRDLRESARRARLAAQARPAGKRPITLPAVRFTQWRKPAPERALCPDASRPATR